MKIGIMTMHRVQNIGSVLQAYALQSAIKQLGHESEIIDYVFPPTNRGKRMSIKDIPGLIMNFVNGNPSEKRFQKINSFRQEFLNCSQVSYDRDGLLRHPPLYNAYCTGSDQVWNPKHIKEDTSFMLDFAPDNAPRIAYASSFALKSIPEPYYSLYAPLLSKYVGITVREQSGVSIVKAMTGKDAKVVCDPTMLLTSNEWDEVANRSKININKDYILVYLLGYMFNPRPGFYKVVESVRKSLRLPVYHYNPGNLDSIQPHIRSLHGMGPIDFVWLVKHAKCVITDSFHGAAFATLYNIPLISVVNDTDTEDGRIATLRNSVGDKDSLVCFNRDFVITQGGLERYKCNPDKIRMLREFSLTELNRLFSLI